MLGDNYYAVLPIETVSKNDMYIPRRSTDIDGWLPTKAERKRWKKERKKRNMRNKARRRRRNKQKLLQRHRHAYDHCLMADASKSSPYSRDSWLGDSGASTHMGNTDIGMYDVQDVNESITIGNGKTLTATKIGKLRRTVHQCPYSILEHTYHSSIPWKQDAPYTSTKAP